MRISVWSSDVCSSDLQVALHLAGIEDVQRPAEVEGHVVGDVDQRRDGAQADGAQAVLQPGRAGTVPHAAKAAPGHVGAGVLAVGGQVTAPGNAALAVAAQRTKGRAAGREGGCKY